MEKLSRQNLFGPVVWHVAEHQMKTKTIKRLFPRSQALVVHQDGARLSTPGNGIEVVLHTRENETAPCTAEIVSANHYAEISLSFERKLLVDYDGVFFLPREVGEMLVDAGYVVPKEFFA